MITSRNNPRVKQWASLAQKKERSKQQLFLVEGDHLVTEAMSANLLELLIVSEDYTGEVRFKNTEVVSSSVAQKLSNTKSSSDIFGLVRIVKNEVTGSRWLFLDSVQDPGNVGTLIRSAVSFGYDTVISNKNTADFYSDKVVRSSQGAHFHINLVEMEFDEVKELAIENNITLVSTYLRSDNDELPGNNLCLCLGNEGSGLNPEYKKDMDKNVLVETSTFESLNVSVSGSILMYQSKR